MLGLLTLLGGGMGVFSNKKKIKMPFNVLFHEESVKRTCIS
jgi:hypothetical protein